MEFTPKRPGIALGGGAARGLAHIGVLKVLNQAGISFPVVSGTSMGAIVAAAYACGKLEEVEKIALSITPNSMSKWADVELTTGILRGDMVKEIFREFVGDLTFQDVRNRGVELAVVACDIKSGKPVYIRDGRLDDAVRASMSIPGIFAAVERDGMLLVDGGLVDNVPVGILEEMGADFKVAVDVNNPEDIWNKLTEGFQVSVKTAEQLREKARAHAEELLKGASLLRRINLAAKRGQPSWTAMRALFSSIEIMNAQMADVPLTYSPSKVDVVICPPVRRFHAHQFYLAKDLIISGEAAGRAALRKLSKHFPQARTGTA